MSEKAFIEFYLSQQLFLAPLVLLFSVGLSLLLVGSMVAVLTALGNKDWLWGIAILLSGCVAGLAYSLLHQYAWYSKSLMLRGTFAVVVSLLATCALWLVVHNEPTSYQAVRCSIVLPSAQPSCIRCTILDCSGAQIES